MLQRGVGNTLAAVTLRTLRRAMRGCPTDRLAHERSRIKQEVLGEQTALHVCLGSWVTRQRQCRLVSGYEHEPGHVCTALPRPQAYHHALRQQKQRSLRTALPVSWYRDR